MQINNLPASSFATAVWATATRTLTNPSGVWSDAARTLTADPGTTAVTGAAVWATATRSLTIGGGAIVGPTLQPLSTTTGISLTAVAATTCLTFSGSGVVMKAGVVVTTTTTGTPITATLDITIDGGSVIHIPIYTASGAAWDQGALAISSFNTGTGATSGNMMNFDLSFQFNSSILIKYNVTSSSLTTGVAECVVYWAHN